MEKSASYHLESQLPMSAETYGGIRVYAIKAKNEGTTENDNANYAWVFGTLLNSEDFTNSSLVWAKLRFAVPPRQGVVMDYERFGTSKDGGGLPYLIHFDVYRQHFEDGLDLRTMDMHLHLTEMDHWSLYGFDYYDMQSVRGLAEGPSGPHYKHCQGV